MSFAVALLLHVTSLLLLLLLHAPFAIAFSTEGQSNRNEPFPLQRGSTVDLITPFHPFTGKVHTEELERLLQLHVQAGTANLCLLSATGEDHALTNDERTQILELAVQQVKGKMAILAGTGSHDARTVKERIQQAMDLGCDAALVSTPCFIQPPQRGLIQHVWDAADVGLPICVANDPGRTGVDMSDANLALSAQHSNIVAALDATGNLTRVAALRQALQKEDQTPIAIMKSSKKPSDLLILSGHDATMAEFCRQGGDGGISVAANVAPREMVQLLQAALSGDTAPDPLESLYPALLCESNPIPVKFALQRLGHVSSNDCRAPLSALDPNLEASVEKALQQAGVLQVDSD